MGHATLRTVPPALYAELTPWYHLVDPPEDHADEASCFLDALAGAIAGPSATLLELGAGAGHNACHLKARFTCTLTDIAEPMLALSRTRNPECEHVAGDMRTLRLGRLFDAVLAHAGISYMTSVPDLRAAIETPSSTHGRAAPRSSRRTMSRTRSSRAPNCTSATTASVRCASSNGRGIRCRVTTRHAPSTRC